MKPRSETFLDIFKEKMCVSKTSEMTERQLLAHPENRIVIGEASNKVGKLCASQATKNVFEEGYTKHTGMEKRQMNEGQKRNIFRHNQAKQSN